jgi:Putative metal-binding motif
MPPGRTALERALITPFWGVAGQACPVRVRYPSGRPCGIIGRGMGCRLRSWPAGSCLVFLLGCNVYDPDLLQKSEGFAASDDAGLVKPPPCGSGVESCNDLDDDCDGETDEGAERDCVYDHSTSVCATEGECVIVECASGYADCNRDIADGCEQRSDEIACGMCGKVCPGTNNGSTGGSNDPDPDANIDEDAGPGAVDSGPPPGPDAGPCLPSAERCDDVDNDCDDRTDEGTACAVAMCVATTPSTRSAACDECVCGSCPQLVALCQNHPNAMWAARCRDLVACVVEHSRRGECPNADCYMNGSGPCAAQTHIAAGGVDGNDMSQVILGCGGTSPPATACAAAVNYRDQCTTTTCSATCNQ